MEKKIAGYYSIFIGISVILMWSMILSNEKPPEGKTEMSFHLFSEFLMAIMCIISGVLILRKNAIARPLNFLALGMVIYSVLNAAGYYGELGNNPMMIMFIVLLLLSFGALYLQIKE